MILKDQITNIFVQIDDFCKEFDIQIKQMKIQTLGDHKKRRNRASLMSDSEIITNLQQSPFQWTQQEKQIFYFCFFLLYFVVIYIYP